MSILIKGMEMPKRCEDCFCYRHNAEYDYAYCCERWDCEVDAREVHNCFEGKSPVEVDNG